MLSSEEVLPLGAVVAAVVVLNEMGDITVLLVAR